MALRLATRGSELARWQAQHVASLLVAREPGLYVELVVVRTTGDRRADEPIWRLGGKGVFVSEVQAAVLDGRADAAVHSAKDLPSTPHGDLVIAAVPERADPRDVLVGASLASLPTGGRVATGSARRRAQLAWLRPDLTFVELRGNIATRLDKVGEVEAVVAAAAALDRLGLEDRAAQRLDVGVMVPQVGQGALAVECRADDEDLVGRLHAVEHPPSRRAVDAERAFLATLGGDCDLPVGAHAREAPGGSLFVDGLIASLDGRVLLRDERSGDDAATLGEDLARHLLDDAGARRLIG